MVIVVVVDGKRSGSIDREKDLGGWIGKRVVELSSWIDWLRNLGSHHS